MCDWDKFLEEKLKNPEIRAEWDALEPEFSAIQAEIDSKRNARLAEKQMVLTENREVVLT